mmetsp:Transcript_43570/g.42045  ORF Transcript_43570/g.42045 Transcript_43570/m.42045 type:complete len:206 (+) Transcript_43570:706-1323(+)
MPFSHGFISQVQDQWHQGSEILNIGLEDVVDGPSSDFLVELFDLVLVLRGLIVHSLDVEFLELLRPPQIPLAVPLLLHVPHLRQLHNLLLHMVQLRLRHWVYVEDVQTKFHLFFFLAELFGDVLVLLELLEGFLVVLLGHTLVHRLLRIVRCLDLELLLVLNHISLEIVYGVVHLSLQIPIALLDDYAALVEVLHELLPGIIEAG